MRGRDLALVVIGIAALAALGTGTVMVLTDWKRSANAQKWLPALNAAEDQYGIPRDILARIAYEESHFRDDIISGAFPSSAGALGMMQLMPQYYASARVSLPFTDEDTMNQIQDAGQEMQHLFARFASWPLAVAAYNAGEGNVHKYNGIPPFAATQKYVADIMSDVHASTGQVFA